MEQAPVYRGNLPEDPPELVGRERELMEIAERWSATRTITVTGVAGVGKSLTALHAARAAAGRFPDGVWLVPLARLRDAALLAHSVAAELKVRDQTARPVLDLLIEHLAERRCLLVLDGCEHLAGAVAIFATALQIACPGVSVLATSRRPLDALAETVVALAPLPVPGEDAAVAADLGRCASVELLLRRAAGFEVTDGNAAAVARLCRRLDGLPLALELTAAQLARRPAGELAERAAPPPVLDAHGGLWTAIGWSHELCSPAERLLWARASVFAGPFTAEAAAQVCGGGPVDDVPALLASLAEQSVLIRSGDRYRLLDALRGYGASWLARLGEERAVRARHRDRYLDMARTAFPEWTRRGQAEWYGRLVREFADVRIAIEACLAEPGPAALEITGALWFFWFSCQHEREGRFYLERALAGDPSPGPLRVRAAWALGCVMMAQGDVEGIDRCVRECRATTGPEGTRAADYVESTDLAVRGRPDLALERLVHLAGAPWDGPIQEAVWMLARAALVFARVAMGDHAQAGELAEDIRLVGEGRGEHKFRAWGLYMQAVIALAAGDHRAAAERAREGLDGFTVIDDSTNMALCLELLALAIARDGEHERAALMLGASHRLWNPDGGRDRFTAPQVAEARRTGEEAIVAALGRDAFDAAFRAGLRSDYPRTPPSGLLPL
ncbi:ATP-binding protein [Actinomadura parmotrematis]|uniref:ORC1/DEAH AAA+ ATPase domain-containing protein n=1 Tax=Actinomadura parmotrematis TaxID=2864039 RepID=A0ABS7G6K4_9ACTN|nr:AAA family ATPase [Actinomadura parmotrematis]MBW8487509.1 hypothetical protein [Actinomadura parmotrematis]